MSNQAHGHGSLFISLGPIRPALLFLSIGDSPPALQPPGPLKLSFFLFFFFSFFYKYNYF